LESHALAVSTSEKVRGILAGSDRISSTNWSFHFFSRVTANTTDKDKEIRRLTEQIDVGNRASMLYPCQRLRKPIESLNEFHDPQILLTGVRMARDQVLKEGNDMLGTSLEALYNLSRPAAFCVSMKLLTQLPRPKPAESPITNQLMLRNKAVSIAVEAEETTHGGRKFGGRTIHPSRWLRENRELATLWMENDLQTLRSKPSDVRLSLKQTVK
jgi:hypothetical protein